MADIIPISGYNDRVDLKHALPLSSPFTLNIFPVNYCNFRCSFCAQSLGTQGLKEEYNYNVKEKMAWETYENIVHQSKKFDKPYKLLSFMGHGEPLLHEQIPEMVKLAKENKIAERIEIITNGSLLTPTLSDKLIDAGITNIRISLEGMSSESYKETSKVNIDFEEMVSHFAYFHEHGAKKGAKLFVKVIDCGLKKDEEELFYKTFDKISSRMYIEQVKPVYSGVDIASSEYNTKGEVTDRYGKLHSPRLVCPLAFFSLGIWPNGDVAPCDAIYKPLCLGNVHKDELENMYNGKLNTEFRIKHLEKQKNTMFGCQRCCAPDDVSSEQDELDSSAHILLKQYKDMIWKQH